MIDRKRRVRRLVRFFANSTDALVGEIELSSFDLAAFQKEFGAGRDDPMFDSYPVTMHKVGFITPFLTAVPVWDFSKYSYFLEADAV